MTATATAKREAFYRIYIKDCEYCGKQFKRSAPIDVPPKYCCWACRSKGMVGVKREKYVIPEEYHEPIRKMYANGVGTGQVAKMAKRIGVPRTKISYFARANGWGQKRRSRDYQWRWSEKEDDIIQRCSDAHPKLVQKRLRAAGFERTQSAIEIRRTKLRAVQNRSGVSANDLAACMGVDVKNILAAINKGKLQAKRLPGYDYERAPYMIKNKDIKTYIQDWLPEINIAYCDKYWLVDVLTGG